MISEIIEKWIKGILIDGITGNLSGLFDNVNAKVGEIASDVGSTPQAWNSGIFNMLRSLSETVVLPIAAAILALVMCHELIQMITEKNNMHDFDTSMFFRWIFKSAFAILIVSNTWNIVMGVFDATQSVVNQSSGVIIGETSIHFDRLIPGLEFQLESMTIGSLLSLWFQTLVVGLTDYSMKLLEKKFDIDGHKEFYLSTVVFQYTTAEPEKKKLQAIQDAAVQAVQENYQDEPHVEAQVAMLIANQAADNDNKVTVEQVRRQLAEEYPLAAVPFDDYVEKSDVLEPAQAQQPVTVSPARIRRMESRSIHTASGIEVKIPTEILSEDSAVEFLHAEDGSVSLLIKNVIL